jgi:anthranilate phosphoribosyltransferase
MPTLPPDLAAFAQVLDAHSRLSASAGSPSRPVSGTTGPGMRSAFNYCLALMMVAAGVEYAISR